MRCKSILDMDLLRVVIIIHSIVWTPNELSKLMFLWHSKSCLEMKQNGGLHCSPSHERSNNLSPNYSEATKVHTCIDVNIAHILLESWSTVANEEFVLLAYSRVFQTSSHSSLDCHNDGLKMIFEKWLRNIDGVNGHNVGDIIILQLNIGLAFEVWFPKQCEIMSWVETTTTLCQNLAT